jgi:hypothetical protein
MDDMGSGAAPAPSSSAAHVKKVVIVTPEAGKGVCISAAMAKVGGQPALLMDVGNQTGTPVQALAVQLNKSTFGLAPVSPQIMLAHAVSNGSTCAHTFPLATNPSLVTADAAPAVQAAIKNMATGDVFYFAVPVAVEALFVAHPAMDVNALAAAWKGVDESNEASALVNDLPTADVEAVKAKLAAHDVVFSTRRDVPGADGVPQVRPLSIAPIPSPLSLSLSLLPYHTCVRTHAHCGAGGGVLHGDDGPQRPQPPLPGRGQVQARVQPVQGDGAVAQQGAVGPRQDGRGQDSRAVDDWRWPAMHAPQRFCFFRHPPIDQATKINRRRARKILTFLSLYFSLSAKSPWHRKNGHIHLAG